MRDRSSWYQPVVEALGPWPEEHARTRPSLLCQVELALRLLETVAPGHGADGAWTLLAGYGARFARAAKLPVGTNEETALSAARHRLWPMRRGRMWRQSLETYLELPERMRAYRVPADGEPAHRVPLKVAADRFAVYDEALAQPRLRRRQHCRRRKRASTASWTDATGAPLSPSPRSSSRSPSPATRWPPNARPRRPLSSRRSPNLPMWRSGWTPKSSDAG